MILRYAFFLSSRLALVFLFLSIGGCADIFQHNTRLSWKELAAVERAVEQYGDGCGPYHLVPMQCPASLLNPGRGECVLDAPSEGLNERSRSYVVFLKNGKAKVTDAIEIFNGELVHVISGCPY